MKIDKIPARLERKDAGEAFTPEQAAEKVGEFMEAWGEYKTTNDSRFAKLDKKLDALDFDKLKKIDQFLDKFEDVNQKLTTVEEKTAAKAEVDERFDKLDLAIQRLGEAKSENPNSPEAKAAHFDGFVRAAVGAITRGKFSLDEKQAETLDNIEAEFKALNVGTDTQGGYLAPRQWERDVIRDVIEYSPVRALVSVRNTTMRAVQQPTRTGNGSARRIHETGTKTSTGEPTYGMIEIVCPEMYALSEITNQMLEDAAYDMESELRLDAAEQFALLEGDEFINGTGVESMEGILVNADIAESVSGSAATIADTDGTADGIIDLKYSLKTAYTRNARFIMNRQTMASVRKLKDANDQYIWQPGIAQGAPNTIDGDPYVEVPDMPNEGAGAYPIAYGDFSRGYKLVDRIAIEMLRDIYTQATAGKVRFIFRRRQGGRVIQAEAIKKLKCST